MKTIKTTASIILVTVLLLNLTSCLVIHPKRDNGNHNGWFKGKHKSPHQSPGNSGKENGKGNGNGNGRK